MNAKVFILGMMLLVIPSVISFDCNYFTGLDKDNCISLNNTDENLIAGLIYTNHSFPDYSFIDEYNSKIQISNAPYNVTTYSKSIIKDAWISIISISPSIIYDNSTYVPDTIKLRTEYNYRLESPTNYYNSRQKSGQTCQIIYSFSGQNTNLQIYINNILVGNNKVSNIIISQDSNIVASLDITASIKSDEYVWNNYCSSQRNTYCKCVYKRTTSSSESINVKDSIQIKKYSAILDADAIIVNQYHDTIKGFIQKDNQSSIILKLDNSSYTELEYEYYAKFEKKPYYILALEAIPRQTKEINNMFIDNNTFYAYTQNSCTIESYNFFNDSKKECILSNQTETTQPITVITLSDSFSVLFMLAIAAFVIYALYKCIKYYWGKYILASIVLLLAIPNVRAEDCGLSNLASCIPEKIFQFVINLLNAPLQPLLTLLKNLLSNPPSIDLFSGIWTIIVYCLSMFYCFLIIYAGMQFMLSGHNVVQREMAKEWLKNTMMMIVLIQASFYLYGLILNIGSLMTTSVLSLVDQQFFLLTADNFVNTGLEFLFILVYLFVLMSTILFLTLRYLVVAFGVILIPIGIFCYYIPPLKSYGKLIINLLGMLIFITFIDAIILLACSKLIDIEMFQNFKILIMITSLLIINITFFILVKHIIQKTGTENTGEKIGQAIKYIGMMG